MKERLDQALVARGLARSRTVAAKLVAEGSVSVNGDVATKPSQSVAATDTITVSDSETTEFVSRAGHKLHGALEAFTEVTVTGKRCLDAGASTGGFTEVLLRRGAKEVAAVDVGHGQLVDSLRHDPRVHVFEGMNVRYMTPEDIGGPVDLTVGDLSFISLTLVLELLAKATKPSGDVVLMIKPQFEVGRESLAKDGVVSSATERRRAVEKVVNHANTVGLRVNRLERSPLPGQDGNREFFAWFTVSTEAVATERIAALLDNLDYS
ncbi:TlyA family RNA methyltransferase [Neomicrococcus lactis]